LNTTALELSSVSPLASRRYLPWLLVLFVGSGCAALIYEIIWLQLLSLTIGSSGISLGVLLGTFMGGMCLGSLILPRLIPAGFHPLRVYAVLELGIGAIGIAILLVLPKLTDIYIHYASHAVYVRAAVAAICLIPPTLLMGATLPAIARWVETTPDGVSWMGFFYGGNIVGAVVGCLAAGFFLLPNYDMNVATYAAVAINVVVAAIAFFVAGRTPNVVASSDDDLPAILERAEGSGAVYLVILLSGLTALGAEVIWTRLLSLMMGQTVYTFSIILAVFLVGLGIGSSVGASAAKSARHPRKVLGWCQLLIAGCLAWAAYQISSSLPFWPVDPQMEIGDLELMRPYYQFQLDIVRVAWVVLPGAILWGASFPLALAGVARRGKDPGRLVGGVYAANTAGAIIGSLLFALVIVPQIGTLWAERILMIVAAVSAVLALAPFIWPSGQRMMDESDPAVAAPPLFSIGSLVVVILSLGLVGLAVGFSKAVPWIAVAYGRMSATWLPGTKLEMVDPNGPAPSGYNQYCVYTGEGMNVSVAVTRDASGYQYFHGAGKVQASSNPEDMRLQRMLGHISVLGHERPAEVQDVLVVACGAGVTAGSFVPYPDIKNITICDIEPLVPTQVTPKFSSVNYAITDGITRQNHTKQLNGKSVDVQFDDGRHYIRTLPADKKFDIITSDPIDPWVKGCAALNTVEYYEMCKEHLKPGGVMTLWIPLYESNEETSKSVIATFFKVFPNGILFSNDNKGQGYDAVLFGRADATTINVDESQNLLDRPEYAAVKQSLMDVGFGTTRSYGAGGPSVAVDLVATYAGRAQDLTVWGQDAKINTDRNLALQSLAGKWLNMQKAPAILNGILKYYKYPDQLFVGSPERIAAVKDALSDEGRTRFSNQGLGSAQ
jgi:spermidine synthase